jgi:hypothetical protein
MVKKKEARESRPASSPEAREQQLVSLAVDLAERQLRDGTASAAVISHFLKIGSTREAIEREMLQKQAQLVDAKAQNITKGQENEELAKNALNALKSYTPGS